MDKFKNELGNLSNPSYFTEALDLKNASIETLIAHYSKIYKIRRCEEVIGDLSHRKQVKTPVHLGIGQEAIAVGVSEHLNKNDKVFSNHRGHSHYLAMGGSVERLFAEVLGKQTGASRGMGGSMHLVDRSVGFWGSVPIVGATIPIAVGAALASKHEKKDTVAVAYFGDGACEEGVLHECLNLAKIMCLPVIFVCENNLYSSHMDIITRQPSNSVCRFAEAHNLETYLVDGNDVFAVSQAAQKAIQTARLSLGPSFIEAVTFRWRGHVGPAVDLDVGVSRSKQEIEAWMKRDPLKRLVDGMMNSDRLKASVLSEINQKIEEEIAYALELAFKSPMSLESNLMGFVYDE